MDANKEEWINQSMDSLQGMRRAQPSAELLMQLEQDLFGVKAKIISMNHLRIAAAAAGLLLFINIYSLRQLANTEEIGTTEVAMMEESDALLSSYKLYD